MIILPLRWKNSISNGTQLWECFSSTSRMFLKVILRYLRIDEMKKRTSELKTSYSVKKRSLAEYDAIVPASQRTKVRMDNVRRLIESGKADNFYDALKL